MRNIRRDKTLRVLIIKILFLCVHTYRKSIGHTSVEWSDTARNYQTIGTGPDQRMGRVPC